LNSDFHRIIKEKVFDFLSSKLRHFKTHWAYPILCAYNACHNNVTPGDCFAPEKEYPTFRGKQLSTGYR
jgi:hypothetical protein